MVLLCGAGLKLHLDSLRRRQPEALASGPEYEGNVIVHPSAKIGKPFQLCSPAPVRPLCSFVRDMRRA